MAFTAQDVKELREVTGCGMMECKKALTEAEGDREKAIEILREKGLATAAKKAGRIAAEGMVKALVDTEKKVGVVVEVNAETDFVAKNAEFQEMVTVIAQTIINENPADVDALNNLKAAGLEMTVAELVTEKIQKKPVCTNGFELVVTNVSAKRTDELVPFEANVYKLR